MIDLATRSVPGWQIAEHMRTSLVVAIGAPDMARVHRHLRPEAIVHSDRGTQHSSTEFTTHCNASDAYTKERARYRHIPCGPMLHSRERHRSSFR